MGPGSQGLRTLGRGIAEKTPTNEISSFAQNALPSFERVFEGGTPVVCYSPRNWLLVTPEEGAWSGVIVFEHARWDVRAMDFCRCWDREFIKRTDQAEAFWIIPMANPASLMRKK